MIHTVDATEIIIAIISTWPTTCKFEVSTHLVVLAAIAAWLWGGRK